MFARPGYQAGMPGMGATRGLPDVSADASGHTGMALVISEGGGKISIRNSGGTSASAPIWAGMIALADQFASRHLGFVDPLSTASPAAPEPPAFHDITTGSDTAKFPPKTFQGYRAATAGTRSPAGQPHARVLVPLLARH